MEKVGRAEFEKKMEMMPGSQLIKLAYRLAKYGHRGQERSGGERYFEHPKRVALILIDELKITSYPSMIIVALLHDIREDSFILTHEDIEWIFGKDVAKMVAILTKDKTLDKLIRDEQYKKQLQLTLYEMAHQEQMATYKPMDLMEDEHCRRETLVVKLCDRLDNIRDMKGWSDKKRKEYIEETIEVYLPIAEKLRDFFLKDDYLYQKIKKICDAYQKKWKGGR